MLSISSSQARYNRQSIISGWRQDSLTHARVSIIGSHELAGFVGWGLAALGIGQLFVVDNRLVSSASPCFPFLQPTGEQQAAPALATTLTTLNPEIRAHGVPIRIQYDAHAYAIPPCDLIIDATNDLYTMQVCLAHGRRQNIPVVLAAASQQAGAMLVAADHPDATIEPLVDFYDQAQGALSSQVIGGMVVGEVRRLLLPLSEDQPTQGIVCYQQTHANRAGCTKALRPSYDEHGRLPHTLLVGAGALGTFAGLAIAVAGLCTRLTLVDPDMVEATNLNRQLLFYDAVGQPKASTLAARLRQIAPELDVNAIVDEVRESHLQNVDAVLLCVDNFAARAVVNKWAMRHKIRLVNGGSSPFQGEMAVVDPGQTACLNCQMRVDHLAEIEMGRRARCGETPEPSVVVTNQIVGGLMAAELENGSQPNGDVAPLSGVLAYDGRQAARLGLRSQRIACSCHEESNP